MIEVELPDGAVIEFPDGTSPETIKAVLGKGIPKKEAPGFLGSAIHGAAQGLTFGFGDEMKAALRGGIDSLRTGEPFGEAYDAWLGQNRGDLEQAREAHPVAAYGGEIVGATLPLGGAGMAARGAPMAARMAAGAGTGAAQGAAYGYGAGEGTEDRLRDALVSGLIGGGVGAAIPPVTSAATSVASPFVEPIKSALGIGNAERASRAIGSAVERSGQTPADLASVVARAAAEGQPEYVLADALGHPGQRQLSGLARRPGPGRTEIVDFLTGRQADQGDRVASFVEDAFGVRGTSAAKTTEALTAARGAAADVAYRAARDGADAVDVRGALAAIDERLGPMRGGGVSGGPIDDKLARFRARLAAPESSLPAGTTAKELSNFDRVLDVKKDVQDAIGEAVRAGRNNEARLLQRLVRELDGALENASAGYRTANDEFARASRVIGAVDEGAEMARPGARATDNTARFSGMTPDEQDAARVGYGDRQLARVEAAAGQGTNKARPFTSTKSAAEREVMALDPALLGRRLDRENVMHETFTQALGGSRTADNIADAAESAGYDASAIVNLLSGNFGTGARQLLTSVAQAAKGQNEETRQIIARALMSRDPTTVINKALGQSKSDATRRALIDALATAAGQRGGYFMSQNP